MGIEPTPNIFERMTRAARRESRDMGIERRNLTENIRRLMSPTDQARYDADPQIMVRPSESSYRAEAKKQGTFAIWLVEKKLMPPAIWHNTAKRSTGTVGCPDFVIPVRGQIRFIEFKELRGELSPVQSVFKRRLEEQGHCYQVVWTLEQAKEIIEVLL